MRHIALFLFFTASCCFAAEKPNVIYMMLDEWGYYEMSGLGHDKLQTPVFDSFMSESMRFTNAYAGGPTCGPTRAVLLTGQHLGHVSMRTNGGGTPIRDDEITMGEMMKAAGYATGGFGKWGIGERGTTGIPERQGFDTFFGYYHQVHAHTFYPKFLIRNSEEVPLKGNPGHYNLGETHAQYVIHDEAMKWLEANHEKPFFLYLPYTPPHGHWGLPPDDPYWKVFEGKPWRKGQKTDKDSRMYAAMLLQVNHQLKAIIDKLKEYGIDDNTIIFLSGDNGGQAYFKDTNNPRGIFAPNVDPKGKGPEFRAGKGSLYDGGLKVPFLVRWPGKIKAGSTTDHLTYFPDIMPTIAEITGAELPPDRDGISMLPTLLGKGAQKQHDFMYWEYTGQTAVRMSNWKGYTRKKGGKAGAWELYDILKDPGETNNLAAQHTDIVAKIDLIAKREHTVVKGGEKLPDALPFYGDTTIALGKDPNAVKKRKPKKK
jgi:arylsulfatase A-like enzyme